MSAEAIARVVADIRDQQFDTYFEADHIVTRHCVDMARVAPIIDATTIFHHHTVGKAKYNYYEDYNPTLLPWPIFTLAWENSYGNVHILQILGVEKGESWKDTQCWETEHISDWNEEVEYAFDAILWSGGISRGRKQKTAGPIYMFQIATDAVGTILDVHWVDFLARYDANQSEFLREVGMYDACVLTLFETLKFLNCRNVDIVEPKRERHERKRIQRLGLRVYNINVFPVSKSYQSIKGQPQGLGTPLTSVRGHFAHYGPEYGRALLFGKYSGRFWIPQHARGSEKYGETQHDYMLRAGNV